MKSELKIGSILSVLSIILNSLISIFYTPMYMRYLGTTDYGINSLVQSIMGYIGMLNLGLGSAMVRYTVRYRTAGKYRGRKIFKWNVSSNFLNNDVDKYLYRSIYLLCSSNLFVEKFTVEELIKTKKCL